MLYGYLILHFSCNQYLVDTGTIHIHNLELEVQPTQLLACTWYTFKYFKNQTA